MKFSKHNKGVAGLNVLLSVVVMLFVIGFLVMIFAMMGGELQDATLSEVSGTVVNESIGLPTTAIGLQLAQGIYNKPVCTIFEAYNATDGTYTTWDSGNWTSNDCWVIWTGTADDNETYGMNASATDAGWNVSYTYTVYRNNSASAVALETTDSLSGVTDWFGLIIIITAMVVLILLTVLIISSIRGSGLIGGGENIPTTSA